MLYRLRQFFRPIFYSLTYDDKVFISKYLNEKEQRLFYRLPKYCQMHSLRVARDVLDESLKKGLYDILLIKAALLHDIGKIDCGFNIITNSILVIANKFFPSVLEKFKNIKVVNSYFNHAEIAISNIEYEDFYIKYLILNHHNYLIKEDEKLKILQQCDCRN